MPYAYKYKNGTTRHKREDKIVICIGLALAAIGLVLIAITFIQWFF